MHHRYTNGHASAPPASLSVLLVIAGDGPAEMMAQALSDATACVVTTHCDTLASARAYLGGTTFDAIVASASLPDGQAGDLVDVRDGLGLRTPIIAWGAPGENVEHAAYFREEEAHAAARTLARALGRSNGPANGPANGMSANGSGKETLADLLDAGGDGAASATGLLEALRVETGIVAHAINNPLTVIAGNAQLLGELARMGSVEPDLVRPIEDIEQATQQLNDALGRLAVLRQQIAVSLGVDDRL